MKTEKAESNAEAHAALLRKSASGIRDTMQSLTAEIQRRNRAGSDPFVDRAAYSALMAGSDGLTQYIENRGQNSPENLANALAAIGRGVNGMKEQSRGPLKEDSKSLGHLSQRMQELTHQLTQLNRSLTEGDETIDRAIRPIVNRTNALADGFGRKRAALEHYIRGR